MKRNAKRVVGLATRKSAASERTATTGKEVSRIARGTYPVIRLKSSSCPVSMASVAPMISSRSPPLQKPRPLP